MVNSSSPSPKYYGDVSERGNTLVKFFKYKEIKSKYKKSKTLAMVDTLKKLADNEQSHLIPKY